MNRSRIMALLTTAAAVVAILVLPATQSLAASSGCAPDLRDQTPVVLVHGFTGSPNDWGNPSDRGSMFHAVASVPHTYVRTFDYSQWGTSWVDNTHIGPALASFIDCLSRTSVKHGGPGKVVLVDHSMGGLATRYAANLTVSGRKVSDEVGLVITLGTPNLGSGWANFFDPLVAGICRNTWPVSQLSPDCRDYSALKGLSEDSQQIRELPWLPTSIPLQAVAGDVTLSATLFRSTATDDTNSDLVVGTGSALAAIQELRSLEEGTGDTTVRCTQGVTHALSAACWHKGLVTNKKVQRQVMDSIAAYQLNGPWEPFMWDNGKWYVHDAHMTIVPRGNSTVWWSAGSCDLNRMPGVMCNGNALVTFKPAAGGLLGTYQKVWFTTWEKQPVPGWYKPDPGDPVPGETFELIRMPQPHWAKSVFSSNSPVSWKDGNPNWCQTDINWSQVPPNICGA
jgi:pimeloyl-ACP methyl ester carboxylesterase